jgi:hypothetical protein
LQFLLERRMAFDSPVLPPEKRTRAASSAESGSGSGSSGDAREPASRERHESREPDSP